MVEMPTDDPGEKSSKFVKAQIWDTGMIMKGILENEERMRELK